MLRKKVANQSPKDLTLFHAVFINAVNLQQCSMKKCFSNDLTISINFVSPRLVTMLIHSLLMFCYSFQHVEYFISFYSTTLNQLRSAIKKKQFDDLNLRSHLLAHLRISRSAILSLSRLILNECALQPALGASQNSDIEVAQRHASDYLNV